MSDTYNTIAAPAQAELTAKGSRFIADALPVQSLDDIDAQLERISKRERNPSHHCTAYRLGSDGKTFRFNDDGEPSGTAGQPILRQIDARDLTNTLVVVTRYYGGTNLGKGGF